MAHTVDGRVSRPQLQHRPYLMSGCTKRCHQVRDLGPVPDDTLAANWMCGRASAPSPISTFAHAQPMRLLENASAHWLFSLSHSVRHHFTSALEELHVPFGAKSAPHTPRALKRFLSAAWRSCPCTVWAATN